MDNSTFLAIGVAIIAILGGKYLWNWWNAVDRRNKLMEAQLIILGELAKAQGVDREKVNNILADALGIQIDRK